MPQKIGWRYKPHVHGLKPCGCPVCQSGLYGSSRIREKYDPPEPKASYEELKIRLSEEDDVDAIIDCLWSIRDKRRRSNPSFLERLISLDHAELQEELALTLAYFRHKNSRDMLLQLCRHISNDVRVAAAESLCDLYRHDAPKLLGDLLLDPEIGNALIERGLITQ